MIFEDSGLHPVTADEDSSGAIEVLSAGSHLEGSALAPPGRIKVADMRRGLLGQGAKGQENEQQRSENRTP